jgi:hypothetical protein
MVASSRAWPVRAARLGGAAEALRELAGEHRLLAFQRSYDDTLAGARAQFSEEDWAAAWVAGRELTVEQAVAYALEE